MLEDSLTEACILTSYMAFPDIFPAIGMHDAAVLGPMASLCVDAQKTLPLIFVNDIPTQVDASVLRTGLRPKFSRVLEMPFEMLPEGLSSR
jgi:hypothetical protein